MRRSSATVIALLIVIGLVTAWAFASMVGERFAAGDVYPEYSSMRTDPLGSKALYEALGRLPGTRGSRSFKDVKKLEGAPGRTLVLLNLQPDSLVSARDSVLGLATMTKGIDGDAVAQFAEAGGRVLITLDGRRSNWDKIWASAEESRARDKPLRNKAKEDDKGKAKKKDDAPQGKTGADAKKKSKPADPDLEHELARFKPARSLSSALGVKVVQREHVGGPDPAAQVEVTPDAPIDAQALPAWRSKASLAFGEFEDDFEIVAKATGKKQESTERPKVADKDPWKPIALAGGGVVLAERRVGAGSVVIATESTFTSNEGLANEPRPRFLAWLVGDAREVIFDETHLGTKEEPGIMSLVRKHQLHGLLIGGLILFGLFVWRSSLSLVPASDEEDDVTRAVSGHGATAGLVSLLKRGISRGQMMAKCFESWEKTAALRHESMQARIEAARALLPPPHVKRAKPGVLAELYRQICETLHPRRNSRP